VGFVEDHDRGAAAFDLLDGEGVDGLRTGVPRWVSGRVPRAATIWWWMPQTPTVGLGR
jgi:hypothetical protein